MAYRLRRRPDSESALNNWRDQNKNKAKSFLQKIDYGVP